MELKTILLQKLQINLEMEMINLIEYGHESFIDKKDYNEEDRVFLSKLQYEDITRGVCRFYIREEANGIYIRPQNYVGTIQLSKKRINILPRFDHDFKKLISMILFTKDIKYKPFKQNLQTEKANNDLYEIIISFLLEEVLNILKNNLFREYIDFNENLKVVRGRIDFNNHLNKNFLMGDSIYCKYEDLNSNIVENQIVLRALNIAAHITVDPNKKKTIKRYVSIFSELCQEFKSKKVPRINYNRLNSHYIEAHYYSKLLIECIGSENLHQTGEHKSRYSLLVDMNDLFDKFVTKLFQKCLSSIYEISPQYVVSDAILNDKNKTYRRIKPDIILRNKDKPNEYVIIDTKNKSYGNKNVYNEDIYQLSFYGMYFYNMFKAKPNIVIIYPKYENEIEKSESIFINTLDNLTEKPFIKVCSIDINECIDLSEQEAKGRDKLRVKISTMILNYF
jgi:5-methylcytosine-specific restriction enzyme subunit McrC